MNIKTANVKSFHNKKYRYLTATIKNNTLSYHESKGKLYDVTEFDEVYKQLAKDIKKETCAKLGISESKIDSVANDLNSTYESLFNLNAAIQEAPRVIDFAKSREEVVGSPGVYKYVRGNFKRSSNPSIGETAKLINGKSFKDIKASIEMFDKYMKNINKAMHNQNLSSMKEAIESTNAFKKSSKTGKERWVREASNLQGKMGEGLISGIIQEINQNTPSLLTYGEGNFDVVAGKKTTTTSKGDVSWSINIGNRKSELNFSVKTSFATKNNSFFAVKGLPIDTLPVSEDFKKSIKELRTSYSHRSSKKAIPSKFKDTVVIGKFVASMVASYAFGGSLNRSLNIIYFRKQYDEYGLPYGKLYFKFLYQYFEDISNKQLYPLSQSSINSKTVRQDSQSFTEALYDARNLTKQTLTISGKFL